MKYNKTKNIKEHFDVVSPFYYKLWGIHIHHGYYTAGNESTRDATNKLLDIVTKEIPWKAKVLDVGSGVGGTAIYLAKRKKCRVTGITISEKQIELATQLTRKVFPKPCFVLQDANNLMLKEKFDAVIAIEVLSHLQKREEFFKRVAKILNKNGTIRIGAWLKNSSLTEEERKKYILPIEKGMMVDLPTKEEYLNHFQKNGFELIYFEDASTHVAKTWDLCLSIIKKKELWKIAMQHGKLFLNYLYAFKAMRDGYSSGAFRYGIIIARKR